MTGRELLAELQHLPCDLEVLAFEAGCDDYCEREVDELELQGGRVYLHLGPAATSHPGTSRLRPWLRSTPTRRRPCGSCEPPSASSKSCGSSTMTTARARTTTKSTTKGGRPRRPPGSVKVAGGVRWYTTR